MIIDKKLNNLIADKKTILFAAGGTGGHLFPAQALAEELLEAYPNIDLFFAGAKLSDNNYFNKTRFAYCDILSMTPFRGGILKILMSLKDLFKGIKASFKLLKAKKPDIIIGFGSFHAFPILFAAQFKKIPMILFESNAVPGKVIRFFSKKALFTGIYFPEAQKHLKGKTIEVEIPKIKTSFNLEISQNKAREHFGLEANVSTLLIFGGSQGAKRINQLALELLPQLSKNNFIFQVLHFTGNKEATQAVLEVCKNLNVRCYVKDFEPKMDLAWRAADTVICRSGAMTISELMQYEVPGILIPYPFAADKHQLKNALFVEKIVGGAVHFTEDKLSTEEIVEIIASLWTPGVLKKQEMKSAIQQFKAQRKKANLSSQILSHMILHG